MLSARQFTGIKSSATRRLVHWSKHFRPGSQDELKLSKPVTLAGRDFLASSQSPGFPEFLSGPRKNIPLYLKANSEKQFTAATWGLYSREIIDMAYEQYEKSGVAVAILFRGMPIQTTDDFNEWVNALKMERVPYAEPTGITPQLAEFVTSGSTEPSDYSIEPHNERSYMSTYPDIFTICMFKKSADGGETAVADNRETLRKLDRRFTGKCERKQLRYWKYHPDANGGHPSNVYKSWQQQFRTDDKTKVESELENSEYNFKWHQGNDLVMWHNRSAFIQHPKSGERLWFNQVSSGHCSYLSSMPIFQNVQLPNHEFPYHCTYGDGEEIEAEYLDELRRINWENAVGFDWKEGDVLFLDNLIMQHSRLSFKGDRFVGISLLNMN